MGRFDPPLKINLIPLPQKRKINPPHFPPLPRLYLELIENKDKCLPELVDKEFVMPEEYYQRPEFRERNKEELRNHLNRSSKGGRDGIDTSPVKSGEADAVFADEKEGDDRHEERRGDDRRGDERREEKRGDDYKRDERRDDYRRDDRREEKRGDDGYTDYYRRRDERREDDDPRDDRRGDDHRGGRREERRGDDRRGDDRRGDDRRGDDRRGDDSEHFREKTLDDFLKVSHSSGDRESRRRETYERKKDRIFADFVPPSLAEIEEGGAFRGNGPPDLTRTTKSAQDKEDKMRELVYKFKILKRMYPNADIPIVTPLSDPVKEQRVYDEMVKQLYLDNAVVKYKRWLMASFMVLEFTLRGAGFDMTGFTTQQIVDMNTYEHCLIEIGEKSYMPTSNWPVELRLLGLVIFNAATFIGGKMLSKAMGSGPNPVEQMNRMPGMGLAGGQPTASATQANPRRRMTGPAMNIDDLTGPVSTGPATSMGQPPVKTAATQVKPNEPYVPQTLNNFQPPAPVAETTGVIPPQPVKA
jgi:hypothetical protein